MTLKGYTMPGNNMRGKLVPRELTSRLVSFIQKYNEKDKYLIYRVNNRALNNKPSYVFKSCEHIIAKMALAMDKNGDGILCKEYAYVDGKHDHYRGLKNDIMELRSSFKENGFVGSENTENLMFWLFVNEMLSEVSGQEGYKFNPIGFIADENHANWLSIKAVYWEDTLSQISPCEFHYKQSIQ